MSDSAFPASRASGRWWLVLIALMVLSAALYLRPRTVEVATFDGRTMGTSYRVRLAAGRSADSITHLQRGVDSVLTAVNAGMSTYDPTSELSRINDVATLAPIPISRDLALVLATSLRVHRESGGSFDVTVQPLVEAWGFGPEALPGVKPSEAALDEIRQYIGSDKMTLDGTTLTKMHPRVAIDLSAVAKGFGVDRVSDWLAEHGEPGHLVEIGGELRARGRRPDGEPYRVGIEEPRPTGRAVRLVLQVEGKGLATSGNYRNFFVMDGEEYAHTINPVTGWPVKHEMLSASVLHDTCTLADAWATALMVAGPERAWALAEANNLDVLLLIAGTDGTVTERATPGFAARIIRE